MDRPLIDTLAERVERLERECRRWRWAGGFSLVAGLVVMAGGAKTGNVPEVIEAQRFVLRDTESSSAN